MKKLGIVLFYTLIWPAFGAILYAHNYFIQLLDYVGIVEIIKMYVLGMVSVSPLYYFVDKEKRKTPMMIIYFLSAIIGSSAITLSVMTYNHAGAYIFSIVAIGAAIVGAINSCLLIDGKIKS